MQGARRMSSSGAKSLRQYFDEADRDKSGFLDANEVAAIIKLW